MTSEIKIKEIQLSNTNPRGKFNDYILTGQRTDEEKTLTPLAKINIFVGANNSGKSRFMRILSASHVYKFGVYDNTQKKNQIIEESRERVYIPVLRGLRHIAESDKDGIDVYHERTKYNYFGIHTPQIFTGLGLYDQLKELLLGDNPSRQVITKYLQFLSETLFENQKITLIPESSTPNSSEDRIQRYIKVKIGKEERRIYELGDGIQSIILLTFLPFINQQKKEPTFFFIEEPEIHLHPGLQRKILEFYASPKCNLHHFFLTTHSNHLLDLTIDIPAISVFNFRKNLPQEGEDEKTATFEIEAVNRGHQSSLELLGVRNSSVFLVNATIWVEGITDRFYLRKMLELYLLYLKERKEKSLFIEEDVHYSFVEYGGSNITHWSFLDDGTEPTIEVKRLCGKAMVIADRDDKEAKKERKEKLHQRLDKNFILLPCREIENLLPPEIIRQIVANYEGVDLEKLPNIEYEQYRNELLGDFIHKIILDDKQPQRKGGYKGESGSGTLKDKKGFCDRAIKLLNNFSDLPESTQEVIKRIYEFIVAQNKR